MCGIIGYVGERSCRELIMAGLERLEYRGYDSAGYALATNGSGTFATVRAVGNLAHLREAAAREADPGPTQAWATRAGPRTAASPRPTPTRTPTAPARSPW